jgi:hypothetical protein
LAAGLVLAIPSLPPILLCRSTSGQSQQWAARQGASSGPLARSGAEGACHRHSVDSESSRYTAQMFLLTFRLRAACGTLGGGRWILERLPGPSTRSECLRGPGIPPIWRPFAGARRTQRAPALGYGSVPPWRITKGTNRYEGRCRPTLGSEFWPAGGAELKDAVSSASKPGLASKLRSAANEPGHAETQTSPSAIGAAAAPYRHAQCRCETRLDER